MKKQNKNLRKQQQYNIYDVYEQKHVTNTRTNLC